MTKRFASLLVLVIAVNFASAQSAFFTHYNALEVKGEIPSEFLETSEERYERNAAEVAVDQGRASRRAEDRFFELNGLSSEMIRLSGRVLLNDTITGYMNRVVDRLLKDAPRLRKTISVYTMRSSVVNAFATPDGMIMVNLGLLARLQNEDELAFVLSHEIAHVYKKHSLNSYMRKYGFKTGTYSSKDYERSWELHSYDQFSEIQADSLGYELYIRAGYSPMASLVAMDKLGYAEYAYANEKLPLESWQSDRFVLPDEIRNATYCEPVRDNGGGAGSTHPALSERIAQINSFIPDDAEVAPPSDSAFAFFEKVALFECAKYYNQEGDWVNGIYHTSMLLAEHPGNAFLERELARSFYIAALCRNRKTFDYYETECGEARRVYQLVYNQTKEQANTMLLRMTWDLHLHHPDDKDILWYAFGIMTELVTQNGIGPEFFHYEEPAFLKEIGATNETGAAQVDSAYKAWVQASYLNGNRKLYKFSFGPEENDELFQKYLKKAEALEYDTLGVIRSVIDELIGSAPASQGMMCMTPFAYYENISRREKESVNFGSMRRIREDIMGSMTSSAAALNMPMMLMNPAITKNTSADNYNTLGLLSEWIDSKVVFDDSSILVMPFPVSSIQRMEQQCGGTRVVNCGYIQLQAGRELHPYSYAFILMSYAVPNLAWTLTKPHFAAVYYFQVFDLRSGMAQYDELTEIDHQVYRRSIISTHVYASLLNQSK